MRRRYVREWILTWALAVFSLLLLPPLVASSDNPQLPPARVDALVASIALYPDPLLAKLLVAATYPLEVDEAESWRRLHKDIRGDALDRAIAAQPWDDSIKDLVRVPAVLSMMDDRLEWTQTVGDAVLARPGDVLVSIQKLRTMARNIGRLHTTTQQRVRDDHGTIAIEPVAPDHVGIPYYDSRTVFGAWPDSAYPPMWWNPPHGYAFGPDIGFMTGVAVPVGFWRHELNWNSGKLLVNNAVTVQDYDHPDGDAWVHSPMHRRFVSYSTPQLRSRYGRSFALENESDKAFQGYDARGNATAWTRGRPGSTRNASSDSGSMRRLSVFGDLDEGARERLFSRRGNESIMAARRHNAHFAMGEDEIAAAAVATDTVARR